MILQEIAETPPPPPPPPSARQTIKLKVNGHANGTGPPKTPQRSKPQKFLKPKPPSAPPPPAPPPPAADTDSDDGAKDLLEEVLAIEEEQKQEKKVKAPRLAISLSKKDRSSEVIRTEEVSSVPAPSRAASTASARNKKAANGHGPPSSKGKEKEVARPPTSSPSKHRSGSSVEGSPINEKKCKEILKKLIAMPQALLFRQPVDAELLDCPTLVRRSLQRSLADSNASTGITMKSKSQWI